MMDLPYRKNVGVVLFNTQGKVLLCERNDLCDNCWQFPQGGVEKDEDCCSAAFRELQEETGVRSAKLVANIPDPLRYDFPDFVKLPFKGQEQYWFLLHFTGKDSEIDFETNPQEIEFKAYRWEDIDLAPKLIVEFKKEVYNKVVDSFKPLIKKYLQEKHHEL